MALMLTKRIIPCLDVKDGMVVKGTNFVDLKHVGDAIELAKRYNGQGADELVFLDITASHERRKTAIALASKAAQELFIPFTVGGGITSIEEIRDLLSAGADKVSLNTSAIKNPDLIKDAANRFGSQCVVVAIDAKRRGDSWGVFVKGGREDTGLDALSWAKQAERMGAGEILLTSMDRDGTKEGFDIELTRKISESLSIPVIASGGAGSLSSFAEVFQKGKADAALAASLFHYGTFTVGDVKKYLKSNGIEIRD